MTSSDPRHARRGGRHRRRQPRPVAVGQGVLATVGVALLVAVGGATVTPGHPVALTREPLRQPVTTPLPPNGADGGVVPAVPMPQLPLPPLPTGPITVPVGTTGNGPVAVSYVAGIPSIVLAAYQSAAANLAQAQPDCHLPVALLAAIGKVESGHARGGSVTANGTAVPPILGPVLDGTDGFAAIPDTRDGALDGDTTWARAVGPMQFLPSTWRRWASDGNHDGVADPENVWDASLAAGRYLCADNRDLSTAAGLQESILSYNDSAAYLRLVTAWLNAYRGGIVEVADVSTPTTVDTTPPLAAPTTTVAPPTTTNPTPTEQPAPPTTTAPPEPTPVALIPPPPTTTTTAPPTTTPPGLLCDLQNTLTGLGGLLGLTPPTQPCESDPTQPG